MRDVVKWTVISLLLSISLAHGPQVSGTSNPGSGSIQAVCPDLVARGFTLFGPQIVKPGESLQNRLAAFVRNIGNDTSWTVSVGFYISADTFITTSDRLLTGGREAVGTIQPGFVEPVQLRGGMTIPADWAERPSYLGIIVDESNQVGECYENNNTAWIRVIVSSAPPLTRRVPGVYPTITTAIAAANDGDTIRIDAGTFDEDFTVSKDLVFTGAGPEATLIKTTDYDSAIVIIDHASVVFSNLQLYANAGQPDFVRRGFDAVGSSLMVRNCKLYRITNYSIYADGCNLLIDSTQIIQIMGPADVGVFADSCTFTIKNCYGGSIIDHVFDPCGPSLGVIENNTIEGSTVRYANGIRIRDYTAAVVRNNIITGQHDTSTTPFATVGGIAVFGQSYVEAYDNVVHQFGFGLNASSGAALRVHGNTITDNIRAGVNLFANPNVDLGGGAWHSPGCNDIYDNGPFNVYNSNPAIVYAKFNDWGSADSTTVDAAMYDDEEDAAVGDVRFSPFGYCTSTGSNIQVPTGLHVVLTFANVLKSGLTTMALRETGPRPPTGYQPVPPKPARFYDISTSALFSGNVEVCIPYDEADVRGPETRLRLFHYGSLGWSNITTSCDTANHIVCGLTTTLSPFVLVEPDHCCIGNTGNVDGDPQDIADISDLSAMVDYLFAGGAISRCLEENDVDRSGSVDISDLSAIVDYLFGSGTLPSCP